MSYTKKHIDSKTFCLKQTPKILHYLGASNSFAQSYFAIQTRKQELIESRMLLQSKINRNVLKLLIKQKLLNLI